MDLAKPFGRLKARIAPFFDLSAWILLLVAIIPLLIIDRPMAMTLVQWSLYGLALAGIAVVIARVSLPQLDLSEWVNRARRGEPGAAQIVFAIVLSFTLVFLGLVLWAKT